MPKREQCDRSQTWFKSLTDHPTGQTGLSPGECMPDLRDLHTTQRVKHD